MKRERDMEERRQKDIEDKKEARRKRLEEIRYQAWKNFGHPRGSIYTSKTRWD